jgi:carboxypeptidase Q
MTRRTSLGVILACSCLLPVLAAAADEKADIQRVISLGRSDNRVMDHLDYLCNRFGPRLTGSDNLQNASEWARDTFASFGLENARLDEWGQYAVGFNRGPWFGRVVEPSEKALTFGTNAWSAGTRGVQRGRAIFSPTSDEELAAVRDKLPGAWVLARRPGSNDRPSADFRKTLDNAFREARIAGTVQSAIGMGNSDWILTFGSPPSSWDKLPTTPSINLIKKQYDEIAEMVARGDQVVLEFDIRNYFKKGPVKLYNIIADLPGSEWPDEYVIVGGHIDSWDGATGAMDNGTGVAAVMEAARLLTQAGAKPRRTIRFMLWSGEEQGLLGSRNYIKNNPDLMKKISAVLVDDGGTNYVSGIQATETMVSDFELALAPLKDLDANMPFKIQTVKGLPPSIGSDQDSFLAAGVPGFYFQQAGRANYNRIHHTQYDTFEGAIPEYQRHSAMVIALTAYGIANLDHMVSRENLRARGGGFSFPAANRRMIGVELDELKVMGVLDDSIASKVGIKEGDEFVKLDGTKLESREQLTSEIQKGEPKKTVTILRDGKEIELKLEWPATPAKK